VLDLFGLIVVESHVPFSFGRCDLVYQLLRDLLQQWRFRDVQGFILEEALELFTPQYGSYLCLRQLF
jgi:hypothetical protein